MAPKITKSKGKTTSKGTQPSASPFNLNNDIDMEVDGIKNTPKAVSPDGKNPTSTTTEPTSVHKPSPSTGKEAPSTSSTESKSTKTTPKDKKPPAKKKKGSKFAKVGSPDAKVKAASASAKKFKTTVDPNECRVTIYIVNGDTETNEGQGMVITMDGKYFCLTPSSCHMCFTHSQSS